MRTETVTCDRCGEDLTKQNRGAINFQGHGASKLFADVCQVCFDYVLLMMNRPPEETNVRTDPRS